MSGTPQISFWRRWPEALRWTACFVLVLGAHATAAAALIGHWRAEDAPVASGPAILVTLALLPAAPTAPPAEVAPGPQQTQAAPASEPEKPAVTNDVTPPPEQQPKKIETVTAPPLPVLRDVVLPPPKPAEKPEAHKPRHRQARLTSAPTRTERKAARAMAPAPDAQTGDPRALPNWKSALLARLERYKRYPAEAQARGEHGVAQLAFSVDRHGGVHHARILRSSGSSLLDRATLGLLARAQPLPPPPREMHGSQIAIVVPIRYNIR
jgi:protein TonB